MTPAMQFLTRPCCGLVSRKGGGFSKLNRLIASQSWPAFPRSFCQQADNAARKNRQAFARRFFVGWMTGFEPATSGTTIQYSNQLSYTHRLGWQIYKNFYTPNLLIQIILREAEERADCTAPLHLHRRTDAGSGS